MFKWLNDGLRDEIRREPPASRLLNYRAGDPHQESQLSQASWWQKLLAGLELFILELVVAALIVGLLISFCTNR